MVAMPRPSLTFAAGLGLLAGSVGCSHMTETRVITAFHQSLEKHDLAALRGQVSTDFENRAVRGADTFDALDLIDFPEGKIKVVKSVDTEKDDRKRPIEKKVTVQVGDEKKEVIVLLKRVGDTKRWVVDDEFLRREDIEKNKTLSARLEVLVAVNRTINAWRTADRNDIGTVATPEFSQALVSLNPEHFLQLSEKLTTGIAPQARVLPNEKIGEETAVVHVPRSDGELVLRYRRVDSRWQLDDISLETRKGTGEIASVRDMTSALGTAVGFLQCYREQNKARLAELCESQFFRGSLKDSDLSQVPLPEGPASMQDFEVDLKDNTAAILVRKGDEAIKINLDRMAEKTLHDKPTYLVNEVTIYELKSNQDKRLSALYNSRSALESFATALAKQDLPGLLNHSTHDFKDRVWQATTDQHFAWMPLEDFQNAKPKVLQTLFKGPLTEILVEHGSTPVTYQLRDEEGQIRVDDVMLPAADYPQSLKATLEAVIPVANFALALESGDIKRVRTAVAEDFTRSVWRYLDEVPQFDPAPESYLKNSLSAISVRGNGAVVVLGNGRRGAQVTLRRENGRYKVEDMTLVAGALPDERIALKRTIRTQLAEGRYTTTGEVEMLAGGEREDLGGFEE
jgi:hypothetical protein